jgi:hypothetical protein
MDTNDFGVNENNNMENDKNTPAIPEGLFIEKDAPGASTDTRKEQGTKLAQFLETDFRTIGYRDGYRYTSADVMDNSMRMLRSEFREIIDQMIEQQRALIDQLQNQAVEIRHISLKAEEKFTLRIGMINQTIKKLEHEKESSAMDEGLITKALNQYRDGFFRGVNDNTNELLVMSYNGLFK